MTMRWMVALGMALLAGSAAAQDAPTINNQKDASAPKQQTTSRLNDEKSKRNYALGVSLAESLKKQHIIELDQDLLIQGLKDALADGKMLLTKEEVSTTLAAMQNEQREKNILLAKQLAEKNEKDGEAFLAANKVKEGVVTLASGLQYKILKAGDGKKPTANDQVVCHYRGTLIDGTEFDSSYTRNQPATFAVSRAIKGWAEALQLMPAGSKWQLFIPPTLAYGATGSGRTIEPNATLIFEVELIPIQDKPNSAASQGGH